MCLKTKEMITRDMIERNDFFQTLVNPDSSRLFSPTKIAHSVSVPTADLD